MLLALSLVVLARRASRAASAALPRTPLDAPARSPSPSGRCSRPRSPPDPRSRTRTSKKLLLFALFYLAVEALAASRGPRARARGARSWAGSRSRRSWSCSTTSSATTALTGRPRASSATTCRPPGVTMARPAARRGAARLRPRAAAPAARPLAAGARARRPWRRRRGLGARPRRSSADAALRGGPRGRGGRLALSRARRGPSRARPPCRSWSCRSPPGRSSSRRRAAPGSGRRLAGSGARAVLRAPRLLWARGRGRGRPARGARRRARARLTVTDASSVDRYYMWQAGLDMVLDQPVFGQGPGMIQAVLPALPLAGGPEPARSRTCTTTLMQIAAERGLPGLVFFSGGSARRSLAALREAQRARGAGAARRWAAAAGALARARRGLRGRALRVQSRRLRGADVRPAADGRALRAAPARAPRACARGPLSGARAGAAAAMRGRRVLVARRRDARRVRLGPRLRISPEAPVPVVEVESKSFHLGGAGNVAATCARWAARRCWPESWARTRRARACAKRSITGAVQSSRSAMMADNSSFSMSRPIASGDWKE